VSDAVRRHGGLLLRALVSALLLGAVLVYVDVGEMARAVEDGDWSWFVAGIALMTLAVVVGAARWRVLLEGGQIRVSRLRTAKIFAASLVLSHVLPTSLGGDALRAWLVGRQSGLLVRAATATIVDKVASLVCLVVVAWAALAVDSGGVPSSVVGVFAWLTTGLVLALALAALVAAGVRPILHRLPDRLVLMIREAWRTLRVWARSARLILSLVGFGLAYQVLVVLSLVLIGRTIGLELSFALMAVALAVVLVAMLIPVTIGGLGVREGGYVLLLGQADVGAAQATLLSLLGAGAVVLASAAVFAVTASAEALRPRGAESRPSPRAPSPAPDA
jgi:glycosyltransferase 2 family protein